MLSRVADSIYWMERYLERADNTARFIEVSINLSLDFQPEGNQWQSLVNASASNDLYLRTKSEYSSEDVIQFLTFDASNPNSILSCLSSARENARSVRDTFTEDLWEVVNSMYFLIIGNANNPAVLKEPQELIHTLKMKRMTFMGLLSNSMLLQEAYNHAYIGRYLERADMTSRILDVKYFTILPDYAKVGSAIDTIQWTALLESTDSLEMYIRLKGTISPTKVSDFLIFCPDFPRSVYFCLKMVQKSLHAISGVPVGKYKLNSEKRIGKICSSISYLSVNEVIEAGLHEFLDHIQIQIAKTAEAITSEYYTPCAKSNSKQYESYLVTHE